jgi:glycosyltransferase involved in cell wall biosynthesis
MKKRILHCAYSGLGGHASVLFTLLDETMRERFDHSVLFFGVEPLCADYEERCVRLGLPFQYVATQGGFDPHALSSVFRYLRGVEPDIVMIHGTALGIPILAARAMLRHRWSVVVRECQPNHQKSRGHWAGSYFAVRLADAVVYLTEEYRTEVLAQLRFKDHRNRTHVIPNAVELADYMVQGPRASYPVTLAMISRLVPLKDHSTLISAVRLLVEERGHSDIRLYIAGDGPLLGELKTLTDSMGLQDYITFTGLLGNADVIALLEQTDIYVHCTLGEAMSNSILGAMAAGLPIVASNVDGVRNNLRNGEDGLLIPARDPQACADAVESLIRDPDRRHALGSAARHRIVSEFSREIVVGRYLEIFTQLASRRPR